MIDVVSLAVRKGASDLHLQVGQAPKMRINGEIHTANENAIRDDEMKEFCGLILGGVPKNDCIEIDASYSLEDARLRLHFYMASGKLCAAVRILPNKIPRLNEDYPLVLLDIAKKNKGLFLVVGATGSGKSSTLAAILEEINQTSSKHIVSIEDPIEFKFQNKKSFFSQRCIGLDCDGYDAGLRAALRQDPDVIMIGEIRDASTLKSALAAAETGHLVLGSMHANSACGAISKIISMMGDEKESLIESLASSLLGVAYQQMITNLKQTRSVIFEILINSTAVASMIRESKTHQLGSAIQLGREQGSISFASSLFMAVEAGLIDKNVALAFGGDELEKLYFR